MIIATKKQAITAVKKAGWALLFVPEKIRSAEICCIAVTQDARALLFVPKELKSAELCNIAASGYSK